MAQHCPIKYYRQQRFRRIEKSIRKVFKNPFIKYSLKYIYREALTKEYNEKDVDVYVVYRYIGPGFVWKTETGYFEIHFDRVKREVKEIYLVA